MPDFSRKHLLDIESLNLYDIEFILDTAEKYLEINRQPNKKVKLLKGRTVINLFFENSTRTLASFSIAAKRMSADVITLPITNSSIKKGETLHDTLMNLDTMNPDFIIMRHSESGSVQNMANIVKCSVINAGDGAHQHPTQGLLDAFTIRKNFGKVAGLNIAICGDILHSRVARSNIDLLKKMGAKIHLIGPITLLPQNYKELGIEVFTDLAAGIQGVDVIMMLRIQSERMNGCFIPSLGEFAKFYGITCEKLANAKTGVVIMHPGPVNRGVELDNKVVDNKDKTLILNQVENGVAIRQAVLEFLCTHSPLEL